MKSFIAVALIACAAPPVPPVRHIEPLKADSMSLIVQPEVINVFTFPDTIAGPGRNVLVQGTTSCDSTGRIAVGLARLVMEDSTTRGLVILHERVHMDQIRRAPSCKIFLWHYNNDGNFYIATEAEAYCAVYNEETRRGLKHMSSLQSIARMISGGDTTYTEAYVAARLPCKDLKTGSK